MASINGTTGNDLLTGTFAADQINGLAGNDTIIGGAGNDTLNGNAGYDLIVLKDINNVVSGGAGVDTVQIAINQASKNFSISSEYTYWSYWYSFKNSYATQWQAPSLIVGEGITDRSLLSFCATGLRYGFNNTRTDALGDQSNAAGVIFSRTGNPGAATFVTLNLPNGVALTDSASFGALLIGNPELGWKPVFLPTIDNGLNGDIQSQVYRPSVSLTELFGHPIASGTKLFFTYNDQDTTNPGTYQLSVSSADFASSDSILNYQLPADVENLNFTGFGRIYAIGNASNNVMIGGNSNDTLDGGMGIDFLQGGSGDDLLILNDLKDVARGGQGNDTVDVAIKQGSKDFSVAADHTYWSYWHGLKDTYATQWQAPSITLGDGVTDNSMLSFYATGLRYGFNNTLSDALGDQSNAAGVIFSHSGSPGTTTIVTLNLPNGAALTDSAPFGALLIGNPELGWKPVFLPTVENGLNSDIQNQVYRSAVSLSELFGHSLASGTKLFFTYNDQDTGNPGTYHLTISSPDLPHAPDSIVNYQLPADVENLIFSGDGRLLATGNSSNNLMTGGLFNDTIYGVGGNDTLIGGGGNDYLNAGADRGVLNGGSGNDLLIASDPSSLALYSGNCSDYKVSTSNGIATVVDSRVNSPDGTDSLQGINLLKFNNSALFLPALANQVNLNGSGQVYKVDNSELVNGTNAKEKFIVASDTSSFIFAGDGDTVNLAGAITDYGFKAVGTQLQLTLGEHITFLNVGGDFILTTSSGSTNVTMDLRSGGLIKLGSEVVGSANFNPVAAILNTLPSTEIVLAPFDLSDTNLPILG
jgi:Ca2+-binding RTX toxin-like protein